MGVNSSYAITEKQQEELFLQLATTFNSPASSKFNQQGNIYFTSPNFHNNALIKSNDMQKPAGPTIGKIDKNNQFTTWYTFKSKGIQLWFDGKSRILRINVKLT